MRGGTRRRARKDDLRECARRLRDLREMLGHLARRGVLPDQATKSRAEANCRPSPIAATVACAVRKPTLGIVHRRRIVASALTIERILSSSASIAGVRVSSWATTPRKAATSVSGSPGPSLASRALELVEPAGALLRHDPELGQHSPDAVHQLRALPDEQLAPTLARPRRLLLLALDRNRPHVASRLCISRHCERSEAIQRSRSAPDAQSGQSPALQRVARRYRRQPRRTPARADLAPDAARQRD